jgi:agmatinase
MKKSKQQLIADFDPNGVGIENGNFIGLPFNMDTADIVIYPVPWDVTVSFGAGTSLGPQNLLDASYQLDLYLEDAPDLWKKGIYFIPPSEDILQQNNKWRKKSEAYIQFLESGKKLDEGNELSNNLEEINAACSRLHSKIQADTKALLAKGKKVCLLGGEHSSPLGYIRALAELHDNFGILQFDAHCDLRKAYEGFQYSHASIFYNVLLEVSQVKRLTQIGIRDYCEEEANMTTNDDRIKIFSDQYIKNALFEGNSYHSIIQKIIDTLPKKIYISFDIDSLDPSLCPHTGTPVPGGFSFNEVVFICQALKKSGKEIIGFDLCEVAGNGNWDGNVGARILYRLMTLFSEQ